MRARQVSAYRTVERAVDFGNRFAFGCEARARGNSVPNAGPWSILRADSRRPWKYSPPRRARAGGGPRVPAARRPRRRRNSCSWRTPASASAPGAAPRSGSGTRRRDPPRRSTASPRSAALAAADTPPLRAAARGTYAAARPGREPSSAAQGARCGAGRAAGTARCRAAPPLSRCRTSVATNVAASTRRLAAAGARDGRDVMEVDQAPGHQEQDRRPSPAIGRKAASGATSEHDQHQNSRRREHRGQRRLRAGLVVHAAAVERAARGVGRRRSCRRCSTGPGR